MAMVDSVTTLPERPRTVTAQPKRRRRLVIVSNRVGPVEAGKASEGGLAVALRAALEQSGGIWFGFSGTVSKQPTETPHQTTVGNITWATLDLTKQDLDDYYIGYSNRVLWPLFHYRPSLVEFSRRALAGYQRVNDLFARALQPLLEPDDLIWVHDYHLIPLANALRRLGCRQSIGFFLHTPFPAAEVMRLLPNHRELVAELCAYDLIGFQAHSHLQGFRDYVLRSGGGTDLGGTRLQAFGHELDADVFPVGIDVDNIEGLAAKAAKRSRQMRRLVDSIDDRRLLIGVDRLDYSKGLPERFAAYEYLLEHFPEIRGRTVFMQIAPPSRSDVPEYKQIRRALNHAAGSINGRYAEFDQAPLRWLNKSFNHSILTGFFRAADLALVTPLRDGMNLVVKEYLASQSADDPGMPVLSCFAGAAEELAEAIIVNPYDKEGMAEAIREGLAMPLGERQERWSAMMTTLRRNDTNAWRERFVTALSAVTAGA